ncbi:MAG: HEPN domain-containing protein [Brevinematia bacterium]
MVLIGDEGVDVRVVYIKKETKPTVEPMAKELFDFNIERINTIVNGCTLGDFLFESTCVQLDIVLLVSALETYLKKRFVELEHEGWDANFNALCNKIFSSKYRERRKEEIEEKASSQGKSKLEVLVEEFREMNFQDLDKCKRIYDSCYDIKINEIVSSQLMEKVKHFITFRHKIVHSVGDLTILNYDEIPMKTPIFANEKILEEVRDTFVDFVKRVHEFTTSKTTR